MKRGLVIFALCLLVITAGAITRDEAYSRVVNNLLANDLDGRAITALTNMVAAGDTVVDWHHTAYKAPSTSWFFLVNDYWDAEWEHACRYVFVDSVTGDITSYPGIAPLLQSNNIDEYYTSLVSSSIRGKHSYELPYVYPKPMLERMKKVTLGNSPNGINYAMFVEGGANLSNNWSRYYGAVQDLMNCIKNKYGYTNDRIFVAMSDGLNPAVDQHYSGGGSNYNLNSEPDIDGDGNNEIGYVANTAGLNQMAADLAAVMTDQDTLFVNVTDHGGNGGGYANNYINLWNETINYTNFRTLLDGIPKKYLNICCVPCYSGGIMAAFEDSENTVITTSVDGNHSAYARSVGGNYMFYSEYIFWWTGAVNGSTPPDHEPPIDCSAADTDGDTFIDMYEAYMWAKTHDTIDITPQYYENPTGFGSTVNLDGLEGYVGVTVTNFAASNSTDRVILNWSAQGITSLAGFNIYRAEATAKPRFERINTGNIIGLSPFRYEDTSVEKGVKYLYKLQAVEHSGLSSWTGPITGRTSAGLPTNFSLSVNPNPARGHASINYSVASTFGNTDTRLTISDLSGRTVKVLQSGAVAPGNYTLQWDGTDASGSPAPAGVYICVMNSGGQHLTKRIVFTR